MFCPNCGKELPDGTAFCTSCGANLTEQTPTAAQNIPEPEAFSAPDAAQFVPAPATETPFNGAAAQHEPVFTGFETLKKTFSSPLFLTMCILISVVAVFSIFQLSFNLYAILGTIACWMIYANAKSESTPLKQGGYKFAAIITRIIFVINWIIVGVFSLFELVLVFVCVGFKDILENPYLWSEMSGELNGIFSEYSEEMQEIVPGFNFDFSAGDFIAAFSSFFFIIAIAVIAVAIAFAIVYNLCYVRHIDKYTHALSDSFVSGHVTVYNKSLATRFLVFGIIGAVFTLPSIMSAMFFMPLTCLAAACGAAFPILAYALINSAKSDD